MKKGLLFLICFMVFISKCNAKKTKVYLDKCIDGDTASVILNDVKTKVRFIAVDSPEIDALEPYSSEAKDFTCNILTNAKNIYLEFDSKSDKYDKYDRMIAWVWADNTLVQQELVKNGYARVAYLYDDYKYASELKNFEIHAKQNKLNIWSDETYVEKHQEKKKDKITKETIMDKIEKYYTLIAIILCMLLALITYYHKCKKTK